MAEPTELPVWATDPEALIEEPTESKQEQGWTTNTNTPSGVGEKPPLQYFNWWQNLVYQWVSYFKGIVDALPTFGTMASQDADSVAITGGAIDDTPIGETTPSTGKFTSLQCSSTPTVDDDVVNKGYLDTYTLFYTGMAMPFLGSATTAPSGWIKLTNGTIGSASSGATIRANADTADLFAVLWNTFSNSVCPVSGGRGANAAADFAANKTLALDEFAARVMAPYGQNPTVTGATNWAVGDITGEETHTLSIGEMPSHAHTFVMGESASGSGSRPGVGTPTPDTGTCTTSSEGSGSPHDIMNPTVFVMFIVKL